MFIPIVKNFRNALLLATLLTGGVSLAAFVEPSAPAPGGNVYAPLHSGSAGQVKEGNFGANKITTTGRLCFGASSCISGWWDIANPSCQLQVKKVNHNQAAGFNLGSSSGNNTCNHYLTQASKNAGWVGVGSDNCGTMWDRDCQAPSTCIFMRMKCVGVVADLPTTSPTPPGFETHPVSGFTQ